MKGRREQKPSSNDMRQLSSGGVVEVEFGSPGSHYAQDQGCLCPSAENNRGKGSAYWSQNDMGRRWIYHPFCPRHPTLRIGAHTLDAGKGFRILRPPAEEEEHDENQVL